MKRKLILILFMVGIIWSGCATILLPRYQTIHFDTGNDSASVFINNDSIGMGAQLDSKVKRGETTDIIVKAPGHKPQREALVPNHRSTAFWLLQPLNLPTVFIGILYDFTFDKNVSFVSDQNYDLGKSKLRMHLDSTEKFLKPGELSYLETDNPTRFMRIGADYPKDPEELDRVLEEAKQKHLKYLKTPKGIAETKLRNQQRANSTNTSDDGTSELYQAVIDNAINVTNFNQNSKKVFRDELNTFTLNGRIDAIEYYSIDGKRWSQHMNKSRLYMTWIFENSYGEIIDSIKTSSWSGNMNIEQMFGYYEPKYPVLADAIYTNYVSLTYSGEFADLMRKTEAIQPSYTALTIKKPSAKLEDKGQAMQATVTIKTAEGHGSGFAISQDGYIITNYHVIANQSKDNFTGITVLDFEGKSHGATLERFDKQHDLALLKIDHTFNYAFKITDDSLNTDEIGNTFYAIGTPSSIELVQSISVGLLSGVVNNNGVELLQLNMSVNPGNSGGPVFDKSCNLSGVIVAKIQGGRQGICFAIPVKNIQSFLKISYE